MTFVDTHAHIYHEDETLYPKKSDPLLPPKNKGTIEGCEGRLQNALATGGWALPA